MWNSLKSFFGFSSRPKNDEDSSDEIDDPSASSSTSPAPSPPPALTPAPAPAIEISPSLSRAWLSPAYGEPSDDEILKSGQSVKYNSQGSIIYEKLHKPIRLRLIFNRLKEADETLSANDSINQAIEIFNWVEDYYTSNCEKDATRRVSIIGNPVGRPECPPAWYRFTNNDGIGWRNQVLSHDAYFYDDGSILFWRRKSKDTELEGPIFQRYGALRP